MHNEMEQRGTGIGIKTTLSHENKQNRQKYHYYWKARVKGETELDTIPSAT